MIKPMYNNAIDKIFLETLTQIEEENSIILHIFKPNFDRIGVILDYISLVWGEEYQGKGSFMLVCVDYPENIKFLQQGYYIFRKKHQTAMVIKEIKYNSLNSQVVVYGNTTSVLLNQRLIYPTQSIYNVEKGMYDIIKNNKRDLPNFEIAPSKNLTSIFDTQFTLNYVLDAESTLAKHSEYGFYTQFDWKNKKHVFTVYQGLDRTDGNTLNRRALFSEEFGNLNNMIITDDMSNFKNVAYVAGEGEGSQRKVIIVNDNITGMERYELAVDARDLQKSEQSEADYEQQLEARGVKKINEHNRVQNFVAEVDPVRFGIDYYLGDKVTCDSKKYGVRINVRILQFQEIREHGIIRLKLTLGEPEINVLRK